MVEFFGYLASVGLAWIWGVMVGGSAMRSKMIDDRQFVQDGELYLVRRALKPEAETHRGGAHSPGGD